MTPGNNTSDSPLISVIVPVYNAEKYLRRCLDSICGQTYTNLEILCVNDGSTDNSATILEEYAARDSRIVILTQSNAGVSAARNAALEIARGEWITAVDSDDYLEPDAYAYALAGVNDTVDVICFGVQIIWEGVTENTEFQEYFNLKHNGIIKPTLYHIKTTDCCIWNKLWRKSLIKHFNLKFPEGLRFEDAYFYYTLAAHARYISYRPKKKYNYIRLASSFMSTASTASAETSLYRMDIAEAMLEFFSKHPLPSNTQHIGVIAFEDCFYSGISQIPQAHRPLFMEKARQVAQAYNLIKSYPQRLRFLSTTPWWLKPFVKHKIGKSYYGLPGFPLLTISRREEYEIIRLLGIKIKNEHYKTYVIPTCNSFDRDENTALP